MTHAHAISAARSNQGSADSSHGKNPVGVQLAFAFESLDFEGYTVLTVDQIALKLRYTSKHVLSLIEQGDLVALDGRSVGVSRRACRIPLEAYRAWVTKRMTGEHRREFMLSLPRELRMAIIRDLQESLR